MRKQRVYLLIFLKPLTRLTIKFFLGKLLHYGFRGVAFNWLEDYLNNKQHLVQFNGFNSFYSNIKCGAPPGSILGPLLFLININDICGVSTVLDFILSANDTNIFFSHKNLNFIEKTLNEELLNLTDCCRANNFQ